jgi:hypothetical protein
VAGASTPLLDDGIVEGIGSDIRGNVIRHVGDGIVLGECCYHKVVNNVVREPGLTAFTPLVTGARSEATPSGIVEATASLSGGAARQLGATPP